MNRIYTQNYYEKIWENVLSKYTKDDPINDLGDKARNDILKKILAHVLVKVQNDVPSSFFICDFGAGNWLYLNSIFAAVKNIKKSVIIEGIDFSLKAMAFGIAKYNQFIPENVSIRTSAGNIESILAHRLENSCDLIICLETLEHIKNDDFVFFSLLNLLRPGGEIIFSVPNRNPFLLSKNWFEYKFFKKKFTAKDIRVGHYRRYQLEYFSDKKPVGYEIKEKFFYGFLFSDYFKDILSMFSGFSFVSSVLSELFGCCIKIENSMFNFLGMRKSEGFFVVIKKYEK